MSSKPKVLITGASTGIGATYAQRFAERGHDLVLVARSVEKLEANAAELKAKTGVAVELLPADLTSDAGLQAVDAKLRDDAAIGILVNNAGSNVGGSFVTQNIDDLTKLVTLNATSVLRLAHAVAPRFAEKGEGSIINISSVLAFAPEWQTSVYTATKSFVLLLSQALQAELGQSGVYVQAVLPAATRTEIWNFVAEDQRPPLMDVAELVDAALVGFDRREAVTIPHLHDEARWQTLETARQAQPHVVGFLAEVARYVAQLADVVLVLLQRGEAGARGEAEIAPEARVAVERHLPLAELLIRDEVADLLAVHRVVHPVFRRQLLHVDRVQLLHHLAPVVQALLLAGGVHVVEATVVRLRLARGADAGLAGAPRPFGAVDLPEPGVGGLVGPGRNGHAQRTQRQPLHTLRDLHCCGISVGGAGTAAAAASSTLQ